uniref:RPS5 n=1 Tax=Arundo donax TaxID=35708 RepID=A0A0A9HMH1_ARUDO
MNFLSPSTAPMSDFCHYSRTFN